jgi:hypothetical protein
MRSLFPIAAAAIFAAPAAAQNVPAPSALLAQENAVWQAIVDHRPSAFGGFLGRDYVGVYANGFRNAAQDVADISSVDLARFQISDFVVRGVDANNLVVTYQVDVSGSAQGHQFASRFNAVSYWHRSGREWRVQLHSQAQIGH